MLEVAEEEELVRERPRPRVRMRGFGDSAIQVEMMCWIPRPRLRGRASDKLLRELYDRFRAAGIEIPFPQRDVRVSGNGEGSGRSTAVAEGVSAPAKTGEDVD